ncbi:MAG: DUF1573 domain-containing protein [Candidatus Cryptobacteroides sp.]
MTIAVLLTVPAFAQKQLVLSERLLDSLASAERQAPDHRLRFDRTIADMGDVNEEDGPCSTSFTCENVSADTLHVTGVRTTCGCLVANIERRVIAPGEKASVKAKYDPARHFGHIVQNIYVDVRQFRNPVRLEVRGNVIPAGGITGYSNAFGPLRLARKSLSIVKTSGIVTERIACVNSGDSALRLSAPAMMLPDWLRFRCEPAEIKPGGEADLVFVIEMSKVNADMLPLKAIVPIDGIDGRPSQRSVMLEIVARGGE